MTWEPGRPAHVTQTERLACFRRDLWTCQGCGWQSPRRDGRDLHADHIVNLARGGARRGRLQTLCTPCHDTKTQLEALAGKRRGQRPKPVHPADLLRGGPMLALIVALALSTPTTTPPSPSPWPPSDTSTTSAPSTTPTTTTPR